MNRLFSHTSLTHNLPLSDSPTHLLSLLPTPLPLEGQRHEPQQTGGRDCVRKKEIVKETKTVKIKSLNPFPIMPPPSRIPLFPLTKCNGKNQTKPIKQNYSNEKFKFFPPSLPLTFRVECVVECPRAHRVGHAQDNEGTTPLRGDVCYLHFSLFL